MPRPPSRLRCPGRETRPDMVASSVAKHLSPIRCEVTGMN
jgi:hypothetical protein